MPVLGTCSDQVANPKRVRKVRPASLIPPTVRADGSATSQVDDVSNCLCVNVSRAVIGRVKKTVSCAHWPSEIPKSVFHSKNIQRVWDKLNLSNLRPRTIKDVELEYQEPNEYSEISV